MRILLKQIKIKYSLLLFIFVTSSSIINAQVELHKSLPEIELKEDSGGKISGKIWNSSESNNIIKLFLYVAPNQQDVVEPLLFDIRDKHFPKEKIEVTLILNTKATWIPDSIIENKVKSRAKTDTTINYALDKGEILPKYWKLSNENPNLILINQKGLVVFLHKGEFSDKIKNDLLNKIELLINKKEN